MSALYKMEMGERVAWHDVQLGKPLVTREGRIVAVVPAGKRPDPKRFAQALQNSDQARRRQVVSYIIESNGVQYWPYTWKLKSLDRIEEVPQDAPAAPAHTASTEPTIQQVIDALERIAAAHGGNLPFSTGKALLPKYLRAEDAVQTGEEAC